MRCCINQKDNSNNMSFIQIPRRSDGKLPNVPSDEDNLAPIEVTMWKCRRQLLGTLIVCLGLFGVGTVFGWAAVAIPSLQGHKIRNTPSNVAIISSIFIIGAMFAGPVAGYLMYSHGRKKSLFLFGLLFFIGWIFIPVNHWIDDTDVCESMLCIGRFITGFAGSGCLVIGPIYVREICDEEILSVTGTLVPLVLVLGYVFCFAFGFIIEWWILTFICMMFPLLLCCLILLIPNTPRHLLSTKKEKEAREAMNWLTHGFTPEERERIFKKIKRGVEIMDKNSNRAMKRKERKQIEKRQQLRLTSASVFRPLIVGVILVFLQQSCGTNVFSTYLTEILDRGEPSSEIGAVVIGIVYFLFVVLATLVVERLGRRPILLLGSFTNCLDQVILGVFFYYFKTKEDVKEGYSWIPVFCCNVFFAAYALGLGSVTWILATEINHPDFQEIAGTLNSLTYWITAFVSMVTFPDLRDLIDYHWCFWFYAMMNFLAFWYCFFCIYETKGKTQDEIMAHYRGHAFNPDDDDDDGDTKSLGSVPHRSNKRASASGDSTVSDWDTELQTIYEMQSDENT